jgi:transcriptional regulator with XRE-family HTH domain
MVAAGSGPRRKTLTARTDDPKVFAAGVGEAVRRARQSLGWTQAQLAEFAGFSPNYIARLERGELGPSLFVANQLCATLGIDVDTLLQGGAPAHRSGRRRVG